MRLGLENVVLWLVPALFLAGCEQERREPAAIVAPAPPTVRVSTATARTGRIESDVTATGVLEAWRTAKVSAETSGRVLDLLVQDGDAVAEGDALVSLDPSRQDISTSSARAQLSAAKHDLALATTDLAQTKSLHGSGSVSEFGLETSQHSYDKAKAAVASARANVKAARREKSDTSIAAPIEGIVTNRNVEVGDLLAPGTPVLQVVDISRLRVRVGLSGRQLARLDRQAEVAVRVDDLGDLSLRGTFASVSPMANPLTGLFDVEYHLEQSEPPVLAGMVGTVVLPQVGRVDQVLVPREALTRRDGGLGVFEVVEGQARLRAVRVGAYGEDEVEIVSGLEAGAVVATSPLHALADGLEVSVSESELPDPDKVTAR